MLSSEDRKILVTIGLLITVVGLVIFSFMYWGPQYGVYKAKLRGEAALAESESQKRILVNQARAELDSALLRADAIKIVGEMSQKYPEYRTQEFIGAFADAIKEGKIDQIIYVPTEANIPITEKLRVK